MNMMPSSTMWTSVLQATSLSIASIIVTHHLGSSVFQTVIDDEAFKAWQAMSDNFSTPTTSSTNGLLLSLGPEVNASVGSPTNATNGTQSANYTNNPLEKQPESFYGRKLPRETIIQFVLLMLRYYWLIYLEKLLPARPRKRGILPEGKEKFEESEDREEEVIQKWIAQGRIRRASLNWCNTSLKWILTLTVWRIFAFTCDHVLGGILQLESFQTIRSRYTRDVTMLFLASFITMTPIMELIAFVVMPAYKQVVFLAGAELVENIFFMVVIQMFASWAVKTDFAQAMLHNMTEALKNRKRTKDLLERYDAEL